MATVILFEKQRRAALPLGPHPPTPDRVTEQPLPPSLTDKLRRLSDDQLAILELLAAGLLSGRT